MPADEEWSVDTSEEAVKQRQKEDLTSQVATLALTSDLEKTVPERINMFYEFVKVCVCVCVCPSIQAPLLLLVVTKCYRNCHVTLDTNPMELKCP